MKYIYTQDRASEYTVAKEIAERVEDGWEYVDGFPINSGGSTCSIIVVFRKPKLDIL